MSVPSCMKSCSSTTTKVRRRQDQGRPAGACPIRSRSSTNPLWRDVRRVSSSLLSVRSLSRTTWDRLAAQKARMVS